MKILILNATDMGGGAGRAAYRLHSGLIEAGVDSRMMVQSKTTDDDTVIGPKTKVKKGLSTMRPTLESLPLWIYRDRQNSPFYAAWLPFGINARDINKIQPDIVHMQWVLGGALRIENLSKINAPIVWTLHDNWAFTGGCCIIWECCKYMHKCFKCPQLNSKKTKDLSAFIFNRKRKTYKKIKDLTIVSLSKWMARCAKKSFLLSHFPIVHIPNPIDINKFCPVDTKVARKILNINNDKKIVLFNAMSSIENNINKGYKQFVEALKMIQRRDNMKIIIYGRFHPLKELDTMFDTQYLGQIGDDVTLKILYSAADCLVVPSLQETLSNSIMESLACGTPVVAFDVGGNSDLIDHMVNGYLARQLQPASLNEGLNWILNIANYEDLSLNAREKVINFFESRMVVDKYIQLYKEIYARSVLSKNL